ncbi:MAG: hypothetical protein HZB66_00410 [Candidatus Aenigmarchaeota archaeon]|nr:hypothetical protein [Candidatus Aenigmarchaeota archaeon]
MKNYYTLIVISILVFSMIGFAEDTTTTTQATTTTAQETTTTTQVTTTTQASVQETTTTIQAPTTTQATTTTQPTATKETITTTTQPTTDTQATTTTLQITTSTVQKDCICTADWNPVCGENGKTYSNACRAKCDGVGIRYTGDCKYEPKPVPQPPKPIDVGPVCGNGICEGDEFPETCHDDCGSRGGNVMCIGGDGQCPPGCGPQNDKDCGEAVMCPSHKTCPDGSRAYCKNIGNSCECEPCRMDCKSIECPNGQRVGCWFNSNINGCDCDQCSGGEIQVGMCNKVYNTETGISEMRCVQPVEKKCPQMPSSAKFDCIKMGRNPVMRQDGMGCEYISCEDPDRGNMLSTEGMRRCPDQAAIDMKAKDCESQGMRSIMKKLGNCIAEDGSTRMEIAVDCIGDIKQERCDLIPGYEREEKEKACKAGGGYPVSNMDPNGCPVLGCVQNQAEFRPEDSAKMCEEKGGKYVVARDELGNPTFSKCVMRGDENNIEYQKVEEVPDMAVLLSIALKLEDLKMEFDKIERKITSLADYYKSVGSAEENRFRTVAGMFQGAKSKIDEIKNKIREHAKDMDEQDIMEIKHDISYIKDVVMQDILYAMLGASASDFKTVSQAGEGTNCGTDGMCFDKNFRMCQPVTFNPPGSGHGEKAIITVKGLSGTQCAVDISVDIMSPGGGGPTGGLYEAKCMFSNYAMGMRGPEDIMTANCQGSLIEMMKKYGPPPGGGPPQQPVQRPPQTTQQAVPEIGIPSNAKDCGNDDTCYFNAIKECKPAVNRRYIDMADGSRKLGSIAVVQGWAGNVCVYEAKSGDMWMRCNDPDPKTFDPAHLGDKQKYCEGPMADILGGDRYVEWQPSGRIERVEPMTPTQTVQTVPVQSSQQAVKACVGCLNNGVCDPGECDGCQDCMGGGMR